MFFVSKIFTLSERNMWGLSAKSSLNFHNDDIGEGNAKTLKKKLYIDQCTLSSMSSGGIYLQGYMVREQPYGSKKSTIELKPPSDEFKTFYLCAENPNENKR